MLAVGLASLDPGGAYQLLLPWRGPSCWVGGVCGWVCGCVGVWVCAVLCCACCAVLYCTVRCVGEGGEVVEVVEVDSG